MNQQNYSDWQAAHAVFLQLFRGKLMEATNRNERTRVQPLKKLTPEAISIIALMAILFILSILGSLSTAFEFSHEENTQRKKPRKNTDSKNLAESFKKKDWFGNSRSFIQCFCFIKNGKSIFQIDSATKDFECFHGIRIISSLLVIWGHIAVFDSLTRSVELSPYLERVIPWFFHNIFFSVDAFFVLSGFLNAYSFLRAYNENNGKIIWWQFYLKRFVRLTPVYMIVFGFYTCLLCYIGSGPIWPEYTTNPVCKESWWLYFLYINNFESAAKSCMPWCWHLGADMQFYVVSPIFLLSLSKWRWFGILLTSLTIFLSSLSSFLITRQYNLIHCSFGELYFSTGDLENLVNGFFMYFNNIYIKPYTRISPYLIGMLLGYYFCCKNFEGIRNRRIKIFGWIATGVLICISFFPIYMREKDLFEVALYNSVKHLFFSIGLSWIIFVCLTDQRSFVNAFLSWKFFYPLSRVSYCGYLIHMLVFQRDYQSVTDIEGYSFLSLILYIFRVFFWTYVFSFLASLLFEMPMINVFQLYTRKKGIEKMEERKEKIKKT